MGILTSPLRGLVRVFEEVAERAEQELYDEDGVKTELRDLYMRLEAGSLSEEAFTLREDTLVARLEQIEERKKGRRGRGAR